MFQNPVDDRVFSSPTSVFTVGTILEPVQGWEALDSKALGQPVILGSIDLAEGDVLGGE